MVRLGALPSETREMDLDDLFTSRLKLMIIMAKAFLIKCPLSQQRRRVIIENASIVEAECIDLGGLVSGPKRAFPKGPLDELPGNLGYDELFYQRVKLLAVMVKAFAKGYPVSEQRKKQMREQLIHVCHTLKFRPGDWVFLKVA